MAVDNFLEKLLKTTQPNGIILHRLHDATSFGARFISSQAINPCDFVGSVYGFPTMVEAKETKHKTIPVSKLLREKSLHQFESMQRWVKSDSNNRAGYLCFLGETRTLVWVPVEGITGLRSISPEISGEGIRRVDLTSERVDWKYVFTGEK